MSASLVPGPPCPGHLDRSAARAAASEGFKRFETAEGLTVAPGTPEDLDRYVRAEAARWRKVVQDAGIKAE